jgi:uncharacterized RDD family membrane protein YckC
MEYIGLYKRTLAAFMDAALVIVLGAIIIAILGFGMGFKNESVTTLTLYVVSLLYFTIMESSSRQATFGKIRMKIKVVNKEGERLSFLNALGRHFGKLLSFLLIGLGFLIIPFSKKKQALHDKLTKTYVVEIKNYEEFMQVEGKKISTKIFSLFGLIIFGFVVLFFLASIFTSDTAKGIGNFLGLVVGGIIWIGIFYGAFKIFKATGGDEERLINKIFKNTIADIFSAFTSYDYRVKQKGDITPSTHRTLQDAIDMTKSAKNECVVFYKGKEIGTWKHGKKVS